MLNHSVEMSEDAYWPDAEKDWIARAILQILASR